MKSPPLIGSLPLFGLAVTNTNPLHERETPAQSGKNWQRHIHTQQKRRQKQREGDDGRMSGKKRNSHRDTGSQYLSSFPRSSFQFHETFAGKTERSDRISLAKSFFLFHTSLTGTRGRRPAAAAFTRTVQSSRSQAHRILCDRHGRGMNS